MCKDYKNLWLAVLYVIQGIEYICKTCILYKVSFWWRNIFEEYYWTSKRLLMQQIVRSKLHRSKFNHHIFIVLKDWFWLYFSDCKQFVSIKCSDLVLSVDVVRYGVGPISCFKLYKQPESSNMVLIVKLSFY